MMRRLSLRVLPVAAVLLLIILLLTAALTGQEPSREQVLTQMVMGSLSAWHYAPPTKTDWSEQAYNLYLRTLDYNKRFFTQDDLNSLVLYRDRIDDEVRHGTQVFYDYSWELLSKRIREVQS